MCIYLAQPRETVPLTSVSADCLQDKDGLLKEIEKVRLEAASASKQQQTSEKETKLLQERGRRLEAEIASLHSDMEKSLSHRELLNTRLSQKDQEMEALKRSIEVHTKALERGEAKYGESLEDVRILKLEIKRLR